MAYNPSNPNGQATMANSAPVVIASNQTAIPITDNSSSITVDGSVSVSNFPATQAVSGTVSVTQATASNLNANVTVQNASIPVTDNGGSLTVDGTVTANAGTGSFTVAQATAANLNATVTGTVTIQDGGNTITVDGTVSATQSGTWSTRTQDGTGNAVTSHSAGSSRGIDVSIIDGSGNQITSFGGGTQYTEGDVDTSITGTAIMWEDTSDTMRPVSAAKPLPVNIVSGASSGTQYADGAAVATPTGTVAMGTDGTNVYAIATDNGGNIGVNIQNTVNVSDGGSSITIDGTVTASQQASTAYRVIISDGTSDVPIDAAHADGETNTENHIDVGAKNLLFNGSTWDRVRGDVTNGMLVNLGANNDVTVTGTVTANAGTGSFTVAQATAGNLNATVVGTGTFAVQASQSGTWTLGANSGVDIGDVTINNASGASAVNIQDGGNSITVDGTVTVTDGLNIEGDVAHDTVDSGNPVKIGFQAESSLPAAVATGDRSNGISDVYGRQLISHIDPGMQVWKASNPTSTQTGIDIWTPSAGKRIAITYLAVSSYATTAGRVILWFGASGDTTYTAGTDQLVWAGSFAPSANAKPGAIISIPNGIFAVTADHRLKITTDAAISLDITVYGYEI